MLRWSPGAVKATVGVGGPGLMACVMEVLARLSLPSPYPLVFLLAFAPMIVFMFTGDVDRPWARRSQWAAIAWYGVGALVSIGVLAAGGFARHDLFFIAFVAIGAWPCVVAARHGIEGGLPDAFEVSGAALVALLEAWRVHFSSPARSVGAD
jgi:hypothetical protein